MRARLQLSPGMTAAMLFFGALLILSSSPSIAQTQPAASPPPSQSDKGLTAEEFSAQSRKIIRRAPRRVRIYNSRYPGPNSVRICNAHYEQEYRPSGTVIVPRMQCYWSG